MKVFARDINNDTQFFHWVSHGESLNRIARRYLALGFGNLPRILHVSEGLEGDSTALDSGLSLR
jgi:hypothetical protein